MPVLHPDIDLRAARMRVRAHRAFDNGRCSLDECLALSKRADDLEAAAQGDAAAMGRVAADDAANWPDLDPAE
jgi:hypothetical protein